MSAPPSLAALVFSANEFLLSQLSLLTSFLLNLCSLMAGSLVITGDGWGKIRTGGQFVRFWKLFAYFLLEVVLFTYVPPFLARLFQEWLKQNSRYVLGITTGIFGTFFLWVVRTWDYDIRTQGKWIVPAVCYLISIANGMVVY